MHAGKRRPYASTAATDAVDAAAVAAVTGLMTAGESLASYRLLEFIPALLVIPSASRYLNILGRPFSFTVSIYNHLGLGREGDLSLQGVTS